MTSVQQQLKVIDPDSSDSISTSRLEGLGIKLNQAKSERQAAQAKVRQIQALHEAGEPVTAQADIPDCSFVQELKGQLLQLRAQPVERRQTLGRKHPRIRSLDAKAAAVQQRLRDQVNDYAEANRNWAQTAAETENALSEAFANERADVLDQQRKRDTLAKYQRELASTKQVYQAALDQCDQVLGASQRQQQNISVLSWASPPRMPTGLSGRLMLLLVLLLGLIGGCALALLRELADRRIRDPEDVTRELELPMLGELAARGE